MHPMDKVYLVLSRFECSNVVLILSLIGSVFLFYFPSFYNSGVNAQPKSDVETMTGTKSCFYNIASFFVFILVI